MSKLQKYNILVSVFCCMLFCGCGKQDGLILSTSEEGKEGIEASAEAVLSETIAVYVCGQVKEPGVVYLSDGARVVDAIDAAGGMTDAADKEYVNLAAYVEDGEKLFVPDYLEGEELRKQEEARASDYVNINTADAERLMTLPGIGESKALDIITYRDKYGDFTSKEDLMKISGIKENLFAKIKDKIIVE